MNGGISGSAWEGNSIAFPLGVGAQIPVDPVAVNATQHRSPLQWVNPAMPDSSVASFGRTGMTFASGSVGDLSAGGSIGLPGLDADAWARMSESQRMTWLMDRFRTDGALLEALDAGMVGGFVGIDRAVCNARTALGFAPSGGLYDRSGACMRAFPSGAVDPNAQPGTTADAGPAAAQPDAQPSTSPPPQSSGFSLMQLGLIAVVASVGSYAWAQSGKPAASAGAPSRRPVGRVGRHGHR